MRFFLFLPVLLLAGCQLTATSVKQPREHRWQGNLSDSSSGWQLQPCTGGRAFSVRFDDAPTLEYLQQQCTDGGCFADLAGPLDRNGGLLVTRVLRVEPEGHGCSDNEFSRLQLAASGNEPFWNIRIGHEGLILQTPDAPPLALPYIEEPAGGNMLYISSHANHQTLQLWLTERPCIDSMSGAFRHLSARLQWQEKTLTGCAYHGAQRSP